MDISVYQLCKYDYTRAHTGLRIAPTKGISQWVTVKLSYASSAELGPFTPQLRDQSPGAGSDADGRCQPLPLLILPL